MSSDADIFPLQAAQDEDIDVENDDENSEFGNHNADTSNAEESPGGTRRKRPRIGVTFPSDGVCPHCEQKSSTNNWTRHFQRRHPEVIRDHEEAQSSQRPRTSELNFPVAIPSKASRCLALYAATTTMPLSHIENRYLKEVLKKVPNLKVPDRRQLAKQIDDELSELIRTIRNYLADSTYYYSFSVDISTSKGMLLSFIGLTAHVWSKDKKSSRVFGFDLVTLQERHSAEYIKRVFLETLAAHQLTQQRTLRVVTDCGSNVLKAFYEPYRVVDDVPDAEDAEILFFDQDEVEMQLIEEGIEDHDVDDLTAALDYVHNFNIKCVIHRIESSMRAVFEKEDSMKSLRKRVLKKIGPFSRSHTLTQQLYEHHRSTTGRGLKLLFPATTRWSTLDITYGRVSKLRPSISKVCYDNNIDDLPAEDYRLIESVLKITGPIRRFEKKLQHEAVPTISLAFSGVSGLLDHLESIKDSNNLPSICAALQTQIRARFTEVLTSGENGSDPIFLVAACLDPLVAQATGVLDDKLDIWSSSIKEMAKLLIDEYDGSTTEVQEVAQSTSGSELFGFDIVRKQKRVVAAPEEDKVQAEIDEYRFLLQLPIKGSAADFWIRYDGKLAYLATVARNVLSVPAASSSVERLFSQMTMNCTGHKVRSGAQAIRRKALLSFNERYIHV